MRPEQGKWKKFSRKSQKIMKSGWWSCRNILAKMVTKGGFEKISEQVLETESIWNHWKMEMRLDNSDFVIQSVSKSVPSVNQNRSFTSHNQWFPKFSKVEKTNLQWWGASLGSLFLKSYSFWRIFAENLSQTHRFCRKVIIAETL